MNTYRSYNSNNSSGGIGITGVLQIVFIVLKLCNVIDWSWWWVLAPTWISIALVIFVLIIVWLRDVMKGD